MSELERLISELCPNGVEYSTIGEKLGVKRGKRLTKKQLQDSGKYTVYHGSKETPLGYYEISNVSAPAIIVVNTGAIGGVKFCEEDFWCSDGSFWLGHSEDMNDKFVYYWLSQYEEWFITKKRIGGVPTIDREIVENVELPVPPLEVQREIVRILDKFTQLKEELEKELEKELERRKKQYEHYRDELLEFSDGVEYKHLWELTVWDKRFNNVEQYKQNKILKYHYYLAKDLIPLLVKEGKVKVLTTNESNLYTTDEFTGENVVDREVVAIPWGGNPIVQYYNGKFITSDNRIATVLDANILNTKFLYYFMKSKLKVIESFYRGASIKHPNMEKVLDLEIPVPPLEVQQNIVRILDQFDTLCTDITTGLPAEIEAVQKQYEYYRDKLLSFKRKEA